LFLVAGQKQTVPNSSQALKSWIRGHGLVERFGQIVQLQGTVRQALPRGMS